MRKLSSQDVPKQLGVKLDEQAFDEKEENDLDQSTPTPETPEELKKDIVEITVRKKKSLKKYKYSTGGKS